MTSRSRLGAVSAVLVILSIIGMATAANAVRHRHRRTHRSRPPTTAPAPGPVTVEPNPVQLTSSGGFSALIVGHGLPVLIPLSINTTALESACGHAGAVIQLVSRSAPLEFGYATPSKLSADTTGGFVATLASPGGCLAGTHPIMVTELTSPFQTFTVLVQLV